MRSDIVYPDNKCLAQSVHSSSGPEVLKLFSCSIQLSIKFVLQIKLKLLPIANSFSLLININMPTIVQQLTFSYLLLVAGKISCSAELSTSVL